MSRRGARFFATAAGLAAVTQMAFAWMDERGLERPAPLTAEEREAGRQMLERSDLRGNRLLIAQKVLETANEHGVAVLSHRDLEKKVHCSTRTSKRRVPDLEGAWVSVIRPGRASERAPGQPARMVFVWSPDATVRALRDAALQLPLQPEPPRRVRAPRPDRAEGDARPADSELSDEDRALIGERLLELDKLLPNPVWRSPATLAELHQLAHAAGKRPEHVASAAQRVAQSARKRIANKLPVSVEKALDLIRRFIPTQYDRRARKRAVASTPAAAEPSPTNVAAATPAVSREALARAVAGVPAAPGATLGEAKRALDNILAQLRPGPARTPAAPSSPPPNPDKPPD